MIITIGTTEFARGVNRNEPCLVQGLEGSRVLNVVPLTRSAEVGVFDQANVSHALAVLVTRHHASAAAACDYVLSHAVAVWALTGDTVIESPSTARWTLNQAKVEKCSLAKWVGKTTVHSYAIRGGALTAIVAPTVSTTSPLTAGTHGTAYSVSLAATGGTSPYVWTVESGTLPDGLTLTTAGVLAGTPTAAGTSAFVVRCTTADTAYALKSFTLVIA